MKAGADPNADAGHTACGFAKASASDTLLFLGDVVLPTFGKGLFLRRPGVVGLIGRAGLEARAVRRMQRLRRAYG